MSKNPKPLTVERDVAAGRGVQMVDTEGNVVFVSTANDPKQSEHEIAAGIKPASVRRQIAAGWSDDPVKIRERLEHFAQQK